MQTLDLNFLSEDLCFKIPPNTNYGEVGNLKSGTGKAGTAKCRGSVHSHCRAGVSNSPSL